MQLRDHWDRLDFRARSMFAIGIVGLFILTPFAVNNLIHERMLLGISSIAIIAVLLANSWMIMRGEYSPMMTLLLLVPIILLFLAISIWTQEIIGFLWAYPALLAFYIILPEKQAWIANAMLVIVVLPLAWIILETGLMLRVVATLTTVTFFSALYIRIFSNLQSKLEEQALTDALTGLSNRVLLQESLEQAIIRRARTKEPMTLIAIDLDHFKTVNDNYGHETGDNVLRGISDFFRTRVRTSDKAFRLGGEEFLIQLNNADAASGMRLAEELRHGIETLPLLPDRSVTASLGVATLTDEDSTSTWMDRADRNLYKGKESGRNVVIGEDATAP
jgi:diguanylate cyclase (GGDEF)-like protein